MYIDLHTAEGLARQCILTLLTEISKLTIRELVNLGMVSHSPFGVCF